MAERIEKTMVNPRKKRKKLIAAIVVIAAVVVVFIIGYFQLQKMAAQTGTVVPDVVILTKTDLKSKVTASGNFTSVEPVNVGSNTMGSEVAEVYVETGEKVYAGDPLARLKTSEIERSISDTKYAIGELSKSDRERRESAERAVADAEAQWNADEEQTKKAVSDAEKALKAAKDALARAKELAKDPLNPTPPTPEELAKLKEAVKAAKAALETAKTLRTNTMRLQSSHVTEARAALESLKGTDSARTQRSQLETLNENLEDAVIASPITGIVTKVLTEEGQAAMSTMFIVENTDTLEISASVAEYDVIKIEEGMEALITSNATGDEEYTGLVDFIAPKSTDLNGNFEIKVLVTSAIGQLKPGMTATIEIVTKSKKDIFAVPIDAVVTKPDGTKVVYAYEPGSEALMITDSDMVNGEVAVTGPDGGGPATSGSGPATSSSGPVTSGRGRPRFFGQRGGAAGSSGDNGMMPEGMIMTGGGNQREIIVETGMETDYYIEIISDELSEGMMIVSDPLGRNVRGSGPEMMMMGGGGSGTVTYEARTIG